MRYRSMSWLVVLLLSGIAHAAEVYVPDELVPWVDWVLQDHPQHECPPADVSRADSGVCTWTRHVEVDVGADELTFTMRTREFAEADVPLPGDARLWPRDVTVDGRPAVVTGRAPTLRLPPGQHEVRGRIGWSSRPEGVTVPAGIGLVTMRVDGRVIARPTVSNSTLWFGERDVPGTAREADALGVDVYRLLKDGDPMIMETHLQLAVGGRSRIEVLGRLLLPGFELMSLESDLPARIDDDGNLRIQVEAGQHLVVAVARATGQPTELRMMAATDLWPPQEIWAFEPRRDLRIVRLSGASGIDLAQAGAPFEGDLQGFLLDADNRLVIETEQRGDPNPVPNEFSVRRDLWLDFDGSGLVVRDQLDAKITRATRMSASYPLGRIAVDGEAQLVTDITAGEPGIELQTGDYRIESVSALPSRDALTAVGWSVDASSLEAWLHLPPGWRLLWAGGVDLAPTAWIARWNLWDVFLVTVTLVLAWRFLGRGFAALVAVTLLIAYQESPELGVLWLIVISLVTLRRLAANERLQQILGGATLLALAVTVLAAVAFAVDHARQSLYPQLEASGTGPAHVDLAASRAPQPTERLKQLAATSADAMEEAVVTGSRAGRTRELRADVEIQEGARVQTGPAIPGWRWNTELLRWFGPVGGDQALAFALLPPAVVRVLNGAMAVLVLLVTAGLGFAYGGSALRWQPPRWLAAVMPVLLVAVLLHPAQAWPDTVSPEILKTLERRLLAPPACAPTCVSIEHARVRVTDDELRIELRAHAAARATAPIPGSLTGWSPSVVTDGGAPLPVRRDAAGTLRMALEPGLHTIEMRGPAGHLSRIELTFPLNPGSVEVMTEGGWQSRGLMDDRLPTGSLSLERVAGTVSADERTLQQDPVRPFVALSRSVRFGREWRMMTVVTRRAPEIGAMTVHIPLLSGESVLDESLPIENGSVVVSFEPRQDSVSWPSTLPIVGQFQLTAGSLAERAETWELVPGTLWHIEHSGIVPSKAPDSRGVVFNPYSGEVLTVTAERTQPIAGPTVTVDSVRLNVEPGQRVRTGGLMLNLRASEGGNFPVTLPSGAVVTSVTVDGAEQPIPVSDGVVALPLVPGERRYQIAWRNEVAFAATFHSPRVSLASPANNVTVTVSFPRDRWVLGLGGPRLGPAILFWGLVIVVALLGLLLARVRTLPLTTIDALLLAVGLTLCNLPTTLLVAAWFGLLLARERWIAATERGFVRNLIQVVIAAVSVVTVIALVVSVPLALLGSPEMQITGNGSSSYFYQWFQDHAGESLPTTWVFSLPLWVYRGAMLVWSLWLAFALLRWLKWAWLRWATPQWWYTERVAADADDAG